MSESRNAPSALQAPQTVLWVIALLLAAIAGGLWSRSPGASVLPAAYAQNQPMAGARGVFAFTGQVDHNRYGLFMLDVDAGTVWCYEIDSSGGTRKLRLVAARTFIYDRYLQDFNCGPPSFRDVQQLVGQQRAGVGDEGAVERVEPAADGSAAPTGRP